MLRKKQDGRLERQQPDGSWAEVPEAEQPEAVRRTGGVDWSQLSDLFADGPALEDVHAERAGAEHADAEAAAKVEADAVRPMATGADAGRSVAAVGGAAGAGSGALVALPEAPGAARRRSSGARGAGHGSAARLAPPEAPDVSTVGALEPEAELSIEVPGLTSARPSSVLERLRRRRGLSTGVVRRPERVEVSERNAVPRGPAVKETTERRIVRRVREKTGVSRQATTKPAPGSLVESPRWMQELFETHFRSSRSMELRRSMNRMKLSRQDYAIGWMVAIEAAHRDPSILHIREIK